MKKVYIEYWDNGKLVKGYFELLKKTDVFVSIKTGKNIIEIPRTEVKKLKEKI
jgi:hypothetical protein